MGFALALGFLVGCREVPALEVVGADDLGIVPRSEAIQGRDGGGSGVVFGRSVWVYGDTVLDVPDAYGENWHTNSYDLSDPADAMAGFETPVDEVGAPRMFVPLTEDEREWDVAHGRDGCPEEPCGVRWALWPSAPLPAGDRAWILYGLYNDAFPSGIGVARWSGLDQPVERLDDGGTRLLFPGDEPEFANAPTVSGEHLYAFGCLRSGLERPCRLGRAPLDTVDDRASWRFWDGASWVADWHDATVLFDGAPIMEATWVPAASTWLVVYAPVWSGRVLARTAPDLTGPWSSEFLLLEVAGDPPYDAVPHAELAEDDGLSQVITFSQPTGEGWFGSAHHAWRVDLVTR